MVTHRSHGSFSVVRRLKGSSPIVPNTVTKPTMVALRFKYVELYNFKSYRGTHKFTFPQDPGLYLITGKNLIQPRLGSNGVGKSTLLDAIFWALYGRTPRGCGPLKSLPGVSKL